MLKKYCGTCASRPDITGDVSQKELYEMAKKQSWLMRPPQPDKYKHLHGNELADWPEKTDIACWYCCHTFDTKPIPMPTKYDEQRDIFFIKGTFCSWGCVKAFAISEGKMSRETDVMNISFLKKRAEHVVEHIVPAPSRFRLKLFGGDLTIEEFRNVPANILHVTLPKNMCFQPSRDHTLDISAPSIQKDANINFSTIQKTTETVRLKRSKPLKNVRNTLESTMGLQFKS